MSKSVGTVDPGHSETREEGADKAAKPAADTIALQCEVRSISPALSLVNFAVGRILRMGREDMFEAFEGDESGPKKRDSCSGWHWQIQDK